MKLSANNSSETNKQLASCCRHTQVGDKTMRMSSKARRQRESEKHLRIGGRQGRQRLALVCIMSISVTLLLLLLLLAANCCLASPTAAIGAAAAPAGQQRASSGSGSSSSPRSIESKGIFKRSFAGLGCLGVYDKAKFARLDRVCEECYTLYREPDIHTACRQDCFRNNVFTRCVDALLLSHEAKKFDEMVDELYGK